jgi:hypothetical protein
LGAPGAPPGEVLLLGGLTRGYLEGYHLERLETELSFFLDRDSEDYLSDGEPHEELHEEVPRPRGEDLPPWVVELALAGASPGDPPGGLIPDFTLPGGRAGRGRLRRFYRAWRNKLTRRTRPTLRGGSRNPGENNLSLAQEIPRWGSAGFGGALLRAELDTLTTPVEYHLEVDEIGEESLRLWALTEVYLRDYPVGSHMDS